MKKIGLIVSGLLLILSFSYSQEAVLQLLPDDGTEATTIDNQFAADTTATGGLLPNRVYELKRNQYYAQNAIITIRAGQTLRLRAEAGSGKLPIVYLTSQSAVQTNPPGNMVVLNGGNLEMTNICVAGYYEYEPSRLGGVQGGLINTTAVGSSIILDGVILSNINGQLVRTGNNTLKVKVTNSIFANMGALTTSNLGAGKGLDLREAACDSFIIENNTFVNFQDRAIRHYNFGSPGTPTGPLKYCRINHNTFINGMGFHGLLSLGSVGKNAIITNNLFVDAFALGEDSTDATRSAEWANTGEFYPNGKNRMSWIFTTPNDSTQWTISHNYYSISDSGYAFLNDLKFKVGSQLSWHINSKLGADSVNAFKEVKISLPNRPRLMTNMMRWYVNPDTNAGANKTKVTSKFVVARDDYDRRFLEYYRDTLNARIIILPQNTVSLTSSDGKVVGDSRWGTPTSVSRTNDILPGKFSLDQNYPNPFNPSTTIKYQVPIAGLVSLKVYNLIGQEVATLVNEVQSAANYETAFDASQYSSGIYFYTLRAGNFVQTKMMVLLK